MKNDIGWFVFRLLMLKNVVSAADKATSPVVTIVVVVGESD